MGTKHNFQRSTYNPALDYLIGKDLFKKRHQESEEF
jgi:hypothetical protein